MRKEDIELIQNVPKQPRDEKGRFIGVQDHIYMPRDKNGRFTKLNNKQIEINKQLEIYRLYWHNVSNIKDLPESFIRKHQNKLDWNSISYYQTLSKDFIREFSDRVNWDYISYKQILSEDFIREFSNKVKWVNICKYQKLSNNFIKKYKNKINKDILKNNWMYKNNKFKLKYLKKIGIYEILDDKYIIAYKSCRKNGSSIYDPKYKYKVGNTYKSNCDCNVDNKNSFGLSSWTKEKALNYCEEKLLKVKINIEDIGCIVHDNSKVRCYELTVLEEIN